MEKLKIVHFIVNSPQQKSTIGIKLTAKIVDEDPTSCKRWIPRKEIWIWMSPKL